MMGLVMVAPLALYLIWHWSDYTDQGKRHLKAVVTDFV